MKKKDYPLYKKIKYLDICINKLKTISKALYYLLFSISVLCAQDDLFMSRGNRPFADAGRDINTISKGSIFLDGSRSYVSDGSKIKYHKFELAACSPSVYNRVSCRGAGPQRKFRTGMTCWPLSGDVGRRDTGPDRAVAPRP